MSLVVEAGNHINSWQRLIGGPKSHRSCSPWASVGQLSRQGVQGQRLRPAVALKQRKLFS